jgi:hypothetical protein
MHPTAERFTEQAWAAIVASQQQAQKARQQQMESEHLLAALLSQQGLASRILEKAGVALGPLSQAVEARIAAQASLTPPPETIYLGQGLNLVLDQAEALSSSYGDSFIAVEHLLLALALAVVALVFGLALAAAGLAAADLATTFFAGAAFAAAGFAAAGFAVVDLVAAGFAAALGRAAGLAAVLLVLLLLRRGLLRSGRVRWLNTRAHSSSERLAGLPPWASATLAAFSMSETRFFQEVANRLSLWDLAPLSTRVSTTPAGVTFLRRRLKISF